MKKNKNFAWMLFVSKRFAKVDRKGLSALTASLSSLGIAFGVMTLIVVMAVMNGFQSGFIESILEISSFHARAIVENQEDFTVVENLLSKNKHVNAVIPFYDAQGLVVGNNTRQQSAFLRFLPENILEQDDGFAEQVSMSIGEFDLSENKTVIGYSLAKALNVRVGDTINIFAMSGSSDVNLISDSRVFEVSGIFTSDYSEINSSFMFFSLDVGKNVLGENAIPHVGIKLANSEKDALVIAQIRKGLEKNQTENSVHMESWRDYNTAFFGALRMEKNLLMFVVLMIFIVVGVNIFNSMRRMVFERREDIAVLSALGATNSRIQAIFILRGLLIGVSGAVVGLLLGVLISVNMDTVFMIISKAVYWVQYFFTMIFNKDNLSLVTENPMFMYYAEIPTVMKFSETALITAFGLLSALLASWIASKKILKLFAAEVLRYE